MLADILLKSFECIPLSFRAILGSFVGTLYSYFPSTVNQIASLQIRCAGLAKNEKEASIIIRKMYSHFSKTIFETLNLNPLLEKEDNGIIFTDMDTAKSLYKKDTPVIALTAHCGNWELLAAYMSRLGFPVLTIGRELRIPFFQSLLTKHRKRYGVETLWRGKGAKSKRELITRIKNGEILAALIDQDTRASSVHSSFFGFPAACPSSLIKLGIRNNAKFVTAFCFLQKDGRYEVQIEEIDEEKEIDIILEMYHKRLENYLRKYPEQWVWFHKRWRTPKKGHCLSKNEYIEYLRNKITEKSSY